MALVGYSGVPLYLGSNNTINFTMTDGEKIGVFTQSPTHNFDVNGNRDGWLFHANNNMVSAYLCYSGGEGMWLGTKSKSATTYLFQTRYGIDGDGSGGSIALSVQNNGNVGIGTDSPSYRLHVVGSIYATGGVTALSDARHKTIISDSTISVEQIAKMPAVVYRWNDGREDNGLHVGSIAQDWQRVMPEVVMQANDKEGTLSMQYGVAALVSSIITARKVVDHERRIAELERENKELKLKLKIV
jgi:hypothetical protein